MKLRSKTSQLTLLTMLVAMAILIHSIEPAVPIGIPGVKFGLANAIALIAYYIFDTKKMLQLNLLRVLISSLVRGIFPGIGFWLSFSGVMLSSIAMILFRKIYWLPFMLFTAIPTGLITGYVSLLVLKRFRVRSSILHVD